MNLLITNARVIDPSQELDARLDLLIENGLVARVDKRIKAGVEIASDVADDPRRSVILEQVTNGVAVRMAVLYLIGGAHNVE